MISAFVLNICCISVAAEYLKDDGKTPEGGDTQPEGGDTQPEGGDTQPEGGDTQPEGPPEDDGPKDPTETYESESDEDYRTQPEVPDQGGASQPEGPPEDVGPKNQTTENESDDDDGETDIATTSLPNPTSVAVRMYNVCFVFF